MRKLYICLLTLFITFAFFPTTVFAYTESDVAKHNTESDCWVIFNNSVYDITEYVELHDRYMDIRSWCGIDMTYAFETKDGLDIDHKRNTYALLESYKIGELGTNIDTTTINDSSTQTNNTSEDSETNIIKTEDDSISRKSPYNMLIPIILTVFLYWGPYFTLVRSKKLTLMRFNSIWNTILLLLLLIPSLGFGIYMILGYKFPNLYDIKFNFLYWHVELSLGMGFLGISHFLQRINIYFAQLKIKFIKR